MRRKLLLSPLSLRPFQRTMFTLRCSQLKKLSSPLAAINREFLSECCQRWLHLSDRKKLPFRVWKDCENRPRNVGMPFLSLAFSVEPKKKQVWKVRFSRGLENNPFSHLSAEFPFQNAFGGEKIPCPDRGAALFPKSLFLTSYSLNEKLIYYVEKRGEMKTA